MYDPRSAEIKKFQAKKEESIAKHELAKQIQIRKTSCFNGAVSLVAGMIGAGWIDAKLSDRRIFDVEESERKAIEDKIRFWTKKLEEMYLEYTGQVPF